MKPLLTKVFWPILRFFEPDASGIGNAQNNYQKSHRFALLGVGVLFLVLATGGGFAVSYVDDMGFLFPVVVFSCLGLVAIVVGALGSDAAVSRIWNSRQN